MKGNIHKKGGSIRKMQTLRRNDFGTLIRHKRAI